MAARLLSRTRTAIVTGEIRPMREEASVSAAVAYRAEPGVVGRITDCKNGWCLFDVERPQGLDPDRPYMGRLRPISTDIRR